jgi:hypothetical protein
MAKERRKISDRVWNHLWNELMEGKIMTPSGRKRRFQVVLQSLVDLMTYGKAILPRHPDDPSDQIVLTISTREWANLVLEWIQIQQQTLLQSTVAPDHVNSVWIIQDTTPSAVVSDSFLLPPNGNGHGETPE